MLETRNDESPIPNGTFSSNVCTNIRPKSFKKLAYISCIKCKKLSEITEISG